MQRREKDPADLKRLCVGKIKMGFNANELERLLARQVEEEVDLPEDERHSPPAGPGGPGDAGPSGDAGGAPSGGPGAGPVPAEPDPA